MILHKVKTAASILKHEGIAALLRKIKGYLKRTNDLTRADESNIAFEALRRYQSKGLMIDVGAHFGGSLSAFARNGWQVFAFEPDNENREHLVTSFGHFPNVTIDPRAVSDRQQQGATLYKSEESTGISGLSAFHPSHVASQKVDTTTLECFLDGVGIRKIDFLKVDTEGYDLFVLKGVPWNTLTPRLIVCEFEDSKTVPLGYTFRDLAQFLQCHGYLIIVSEWFPITKYGRPHKWRRFAYYPCELRDPKAWGNLIAARDQELYDTLIEICGNFIGKNVGRDSDLVLRREPHVKL